MKNRYSRRQFLQLGALASGMVMVQPIQALSIDDKWNLKKGKSQKVLILGAGMSGMSAAIELLNLGHEVSLLEGQMRAGGRVQTLRSPLAANLYADIGAARIPEDHHWTMKYINKYGLQLHPFNPLQDDYLHVMGGKKIRYSHTRPANLSEYPINLSTKERAMGLEGLGSQPLAELLGNLGDPTKMDWPQTDIAKYDGLSLKGYLTEKGFSKELANLLMIGWEEKEEMGMSILELIRELSLSFGAPRNKIVGGNDLLPTKMAEELSDHIKYGTKVIHVSQNDNEVSVTVEQGKEQMVLTADHVICTFPLTVLRKMDFVKSFSAPKQKAINDYNYWDLSRTVIQVDDRYWKKEGLNGFAATDQPMEIWDPNYESSEKRGMIAAYIKNADSQLFKTMNYAERLDFSAQHVNAVFPGLYDHLEGGYTKCWSEDPWALGAHALADKNQITALLPELVKPEGRLHFAGEHASAYHGWIQGAIESGNRAAKEINSFE
jgi:monoamine oxidase